MGKITYEYNDTIGMSICTIHDNGKIYQGFAWCSKEDQDMKSEKTGLTIAEYRAHIAQSKGIRDNEIKPGLAALKQAKYAINQSRHFNKDSYEYRMLEQQIKNYEQDLIFIKNTIALQKANLNQYMQNKADFYNKIRKNRSERNQAKV